MLIYAWGKDLKEVAYAGIQKCPNCKNYGHFWICEQSSRASLYFIKVTKWNKKLLFACETCKRGWEIEGEASEAAIKSTIALPKPEYCHAIWAQLDSAVNHALNGCESENPEEAKKLAITAITNTVNELKRTYQEGDVGYVVGRFLAALQDTDRPR